MPRAKIEAGEICDGCGGNLYYTTSKICVGCRMTEANIDRYWIAKPIEKKAVENAMKGVKYD